MKKITVVIVTYNSQADIYDCLEALYRYNDLGSGLEVIVVDNHSEEVKEMFVQIGKMYPEVKLIANDRNLGYGHGNNIGIRSSGAPYILIMNPDVRLVEPVLRSLYEEFERKKADVIGMQQYESTDKRGQSFLMLSLSSSQLFLHKFCTKFNVFLKRRFCFSGACFAFRKESLERFGFFDEKIFLYGEERYIHLRLLIQGSSRIYYNRTLRYVHPVHARTFSEKSVRQGFVSYKYTLNKLGLDYRSQVKKLMNMYRMLYLKARLLGHKQEADNYKVTMKIINENK